MKVLLAGGTGYLGSYILRELLIQNYQVVALARDTSRLPEGQYEAHSVQLTKPKTLEGSMQGVDVVISTVGITRQKDGLTYMAVDYRANLNLLNEARKAGVKKFIYVSVLNGEHLTQLKICEAKEKFVNTLMNSGVDYCVIRPNGFFSDMGDFLDMAKQGRVYLFGDGKKKMNPIHGADLAEQCVSSIHSDLKILKVGGPITYSQNQIAELALRVQGKKIRVVHLPDGIRRFVLWLLRTFTSVKTYGPAEFFLTAMSYDMVAPEYGSHTLEEFYRHQLNKD